MLQGSVPDGSFQGPFLSSVCACAYVHYFMTCAASFGKRKIPMIATRVIICTCMCIHLFPGTLDI